MTIDLNDLRAVTTIVTHDSCADGTASALLLHDALPHAEVVFVQHGTEAYRNLACKQGMLFCDIIPPPDRADDFVAAGAIVLDHHRTARAVVEKFASRGIFADEAVERGVSGTVLAYRHVWWPLVGAVHADPRRTEWVRHFATMIGVADTWHREHPQWADAKRHTAILSFLPNTEWLERYTLEALTYRWEDNFEWVGQVLTRKHAKKVSRSIEGGRRMTSDRGTKILAFNNIGTTSDAAEQLGRDVDVVVGFFYEQNADVEKLILSTRSHTEFDCAAFCRSYGGGGHTRAAGTSAPLSDENPYQVILRMINHYEATR